ncbi:hypothetical protein DFQ05_1089 [Winogradskyella wandonensis]|uniref:Outer membrane lipoprotein-sorting protein n=1 Tax=Winogradskyella wandonensis TaxID=1442586 RepID=A0A4R1KQH7_9FLAO|nr:hypothetical protein [Winogradskyella wandonensis]TCK67315.1 hypothetical protein DFQ05_1089 [Winogradskyella wandonensis]
MRSLFTILCICLLAVSCKSDKKQDAVDNVKEELSIAQKIANAHGFENWKNVTEVQFTFQVDRDTIKGSGRTWSWLPKKDSVYLKAGVQDVKYSRRDLDSLPKNADRAFINDKYWLLVPFQLIWDSGATLSEPKKAKAPISNNEMDMITILYPSEGGYTPGDAYDIYYDKDYLIKEWTFRKGNAPEPSLSNTFENYKDFNGIKIAIDHKKDNGSWNLNFTDVKVLTEN